MSADPTTSWHERWLKLDDHRLRLLDEWTEIHRQLERHNDWFSLSNAARAEVEQTSGLSDVDANLRFIHRRLRRWLRALPTGSANDIAVITASLQVAERLLPAEENGVVHGLIARAVRDLIRIQDPASPSGDTRRITTSQRYVADGESGAG